MKTTDLYIFLFGIAISTLLWIFNYKEPIYFFYLYAAIVIIICLIYTIIIFNRKNKSDRETLLSNTTFDVKIINIKNNSILLVPNISGILNTDTLVTIYRRNNDFEEALGFAVIENMQTNGFVKADVVYLYPEVLKPYTNLADIDRSLLIIKPGGLSQIFDFIQNKIPSQATQQQLQE